MTGSAKTSNISRQTARQKFSRKTWIRCSCCNGNGLVSGMFATSPKAACVGCNAVGWLPPDGDPLEEHEALLMLRQMLNRKSAQVMFLRRESDEKPKPAAPEYGTGRYMGD